METIKHLFHINAPMQKVYESISTIEGLSNWWTVQTSGNAVAGDTIQFRFNQSGCDMQVSSLTPNKAVAWTCVDGWSDWIGTTLTFQLDETDGKTRVRFEHANWKEANDFFAGCSFSWGRFMESLRQYCQTGKGAAFGGDNYHA